VLYDAAYPDISVRAPECAWIEAHLPTAPKLRMLDIGCGNGALLNRMAPRLSLGVGVDASGGMLTMARRRNAAHTHLEFHRVDGPTLPVADASIDVVTSLLSFRYLDWDPLMNEIKRVLVPGGKFLVVDMVAAPLEFKDIPAFVQSKQQQLKHRTSNRKFAHALDALVKDPRWQTMLKYNPIRAQHEYVWYLESRFPGQKVETLDVAYHARTLAFDSGPLTPGMIAPQTYP
jgi:ubiquinone/menaquinone biosynthesis C-methylase UbiE